MQMARRLGTGLIGLAVTATALALAGQQQNPALFRHAETLPLWLAAAGAAAVAVVLGLVLLRLPDRKSTPRFNTLAPATPAAGAAPAPAAPPETGETGIAGLAPLLLTLAEEELARVEEALVASDPEAARVAALRLSEAAQAVGMAGLAGDTLALAEWLAATPSEPNGAVGAMEGIRGALDDLRSRSG